MLEENKKDTMVNKLFIVFEKDIKEHKIRIEESIISNDLFIYLYFTNSTYIIHLDNEKSSIRHKGNKKGEIFTSWEYFSSYDNLINNIIHLISDAKKFDY